MAREFRSNFECLGENTEKYITFYVPIKKDHSNGKTTTYKLKFVDSYRFMKDSLSNLVDNLSGIDNKEPENKFVYTMRSMMASLSQSINKISEIDRKISQIDKKVQKNKFTDNMRSMMVHYQCKLIKYQRLTEKYDKLIKKNKKINLQIL